MKKKLRLKIFILPPFQRWFVLRFFLHSFLFMGLLGVGVLLAIRTIAAQFSIISLQLGDYFHEFVERQERWALLFTTCIFVCIIAISVLQALIFSRYIAGPVYALNKHLKRCAQEKTYKPFNLRQDDLFQEVAMNLNELGEILGNSEGKKSEKK